MGKDQKASCQQEWLVTFMLSVSCYFKKRKKSSVSDLVDSFFAADLKE